MLDTEPCYEEAMDRTLREKFGKAYDWSVQRQIMGKPELLGAGIIVEALSLPVSAEELLQVTIWREVQWRPGSGSRVF